MKKTWRERYNETATLSDSELERLHQERMEKDMPTAIIGQRKCSRCRAEATHFDKDGNSLCEHHFNNPTS